MHSLVLHGLSEKRTDYYALLVHTLLDWTRDWMWADSRFERY